MKTELKEKNLSFEDLRGTDLSWHDLSNTNLSSAHLDGANLVGTNLTNADLSNAHLSDANMSGVNLTNANLRNADLSDANMSGVNLSGADLRGADLDNCCLDDTKGANIISIGGIGCDNGLIYYLVADDYISFEDFKGTLREFEEELNERYTEDDIYYKEIIIVLETLEKFKKLYNEEKQC